MKSNYGPIVEELIRLSKADRFPFHMPGHKQGVTSPSMLLGEWLGAALQYDQTEVGRLDSLHDPSGPIMEAERLVAELYGVSSTLFTTNGSSAGLIASLLACVDQGGEIILPRTVHKAILSAIILGDYLPRFVATEFDRTYDLGLTPAALMRALKEFPQAKAVVLVSPSFEGVAGNVGSLAELAKRANCLVIVDEAHGAHLPFHPSLPESAVKTNADIVVQSAHKTLTALTGGAWVHLVGKNISLEKLRQCLNLVQSTSPSWLVLGSLDIARQQLALSGQQLLDAVIKQSAELARKLEHKTEFQLWRPPAGLGLKIDPLKINIDTARVGLTGATVAHRLAGYGIQVEMTKPEGLLLMLGIADSGLDFDPVIEALSQISLSAESDKQTQCHFPLPNIPDVVMRPRQAFFSASQEVAAKDAIGRIAARPVYAYPPGIPLVYPGELIQRDLIEYVEQLLALGGNLVGTSRGWSVVQSG